MKNLKKIKRDKGGNYIAPFSVIFIRFYYCRVELKRINFVQLPEWPAYPPAAL